MPHWARKKDANHTEIADAFRKLGWFVLETYRAPKCADLMVSKPWATVLIEVKPPKGKLSDDQAALIRDWPGMSAVVRTVDDVLALDAKVG